MIRVSASILDCDFLHLKEELSAVLDAGVDALHLDIMDGHFVPNLSFGVPIVKAVRRVARVPLYAHLMVLHPEQMLEYFLPDADYLIFHIEATATPQRCIELITAAGKNPGISLNPDTPVENLTPFLHTVKDILVMSVYPGKGGQPFIPGTLERIRRLFELRRKSGANFTISVDGGVTPENARTVSAAGADILIAGSAIFKSADYARTVRELKCSTC